MERLGRTFPYSDGEKTNKYGKYSLLISKISSCYFKVNSILDQDPELVERLLNQCECYGNKIVDRLIAQIKNTTDRKTLALR